MEVKKKLINDNKEKKEKKGRRGQMKFKGGPLN